jgi:hypothetical protein
VGRVGGKLEEKEGNEISSLWLFSDSEIILDELGRSLSLSASWTATILTEPGLREREKLLIPV